MSVCGVFCRKAFSIVSGASSCGRTGEKLIVLLIQCKAKYMRRKKSKVWEVVRMREHIVRSPEGRRRCAGAVSNK